MFGLPVLTNLYHVLANFNADLGLRNQKMKTQRKGLVQLIVLFSEAVRFPRMRAKLVEIMEGGQSVRLPSDMCSWVHKWSTASTFALNCKRREKAGIAADDQTLVGSVAELGMHSREDLSGFLGLILHTANVPDI